jgi:lipid II:glycine glycyltransferase (peptidoglycan interpeptide bridge formation enzyme)
MILRETDIHHFAAIAGPAIGVFGSKKWLAVYGEKLSCVGIYRDGQQMSGGFCYYRSSKFGLRFAKLPPYTPHCGLFFISEGKNSASIHTATKEILSEMVSFLTRQRNAITILAFPAEIKDMQPFIWKKFKVVPNYTYRIGLSRSMEEIRSDFSSKNRNAISRALKENVIVEKNVMRPQELYDFFRSALIAAGANVYSNELYKIFHEFADGNNSFSLQATLNGQRQGAVFCVMDEKNCYYLLGGVEKHAGIPGVNNLLVQQSIEEARNRGCLIFDFEGSMLPGVEKFFRSFGGELVPYYTVNRAILPLEMLLKLKKRELF